MPIKKNAIRISGRVTKGQQYGRILGFPTANIDRRQFIRDKMKTKLGVYGGVAEIVGAAIGRPNRRLRAAIVIGPIDKTGLPKIEAHLINFKGDLYGKKIVISLEKYIRTFKKFKSEAELKRQIRKDIKSVKTL